MDDGNKFPKTFDEWERKAKRRLASAAAAGVPIQPVILDPSEFLTYYKAKNFSARGDRERNMVRASICKRFEFEKGCIRFRHDAPLAAVAGPGVGGLSDCFLRRVKETSLYRSAPPGQRARPRRPSRVRMRS